MHNGQLKKKAEISTRGERMWAGEKRVLERRTGDGGPRVEDLMHREQGNCTGPRSPT